jgi:hypothetical protein
VRGSPLRLTEFPWLLSFAACRDRRLIEDGAVGFLLSAGLALLNSNALYPEEEHGAFNRLVFYAQRVQGLAMSNYLSKGATDQQVWLLFGARPMRASGSQAVIDVYFKYGVVVFYRRSAENHQLRVDRVNWHWDFYKPLR